MEDSKIIELLFARNEDGIKHMDDTYGRRLFVLADNIVKNDQDAEESVSDTYMKAWDTIPPKKPMHLFAYLAKICRNFALKKLACVFLNFLLSFRQLDVHDPHYPEQ